MFIKELFKEIQNFKMDENYFDDLKNKQLRAARNSLLAEPYDRFNIIRSRILHGEESTEETIEALEKITFDQLK